MLKIRNRIGLPMSETSGMDCLEQCLNKEHFRNYLKKITYLYNSRGFRDSEWPTDLSNVIWCVGDSFTVGIGQPVEEAWPAILEKKTGSRCLNLGEDGCSNDTMSLRVQEICKLYKPQLIVIMWSHFSRRRVDNKNVHFNNYDFGAKQDVTNFVKNFKIVDNLPINVVHLVIPDAFIGGEKSNCLFKKFGIGTFPRLDLARDHHHFDIKTSELVCDLIMDKISNFDKTYE